MRIAVLTTAIPERLHLLAECCASVRAQTLQPAAHLISLDYPHEGNIGRLNALARQADDLGCDWLALLADDDLLHPTFLERLEAHTTDADIVYPWCDVDGRAGWSPNRLFDPEALQHGNYIPATAMIRTRLARDLGWWDINAPHGWEDWAFWKRALAAGARFVCVPERLWTYRFGTDNLSVPVAAVQAG